MSGLEEIKEVFACMCPHLIAHRQQSSSTNQYTHCCQHIPTHIHTAVNTHSPTNKLDVRGDLTPNFICHFDHLPPCLEVWKRGLSYQLHGKCRRNPIIPDKIIVSRRLPQNVNNKLFLTYWYSQQLVIMFSRHRPGIFT